MCGIAGIVSFSSHKGELIAAMSDALRHRGPDDEGFVCVTGDAVAAYGGCDTPLAVYELPTPCRPLGDVKTYGEKRFEIALGHRRLSIVDLSPLGHQPLSYANGRYWIVYNGEIYNHIELRAELEREGYFFRSHADTEIILAAYDRWGEACLQRFNGMWAFALYDHQEQSLFLARDRFGVKPLYYWVSPDGFLAFASEIKAFCVLPGWSARACGRRIYDFLAWNIMDHTDETMFAGVYQIRGGQSVRLEMRGDTRREFSRLPGGRLPGMRQWYSLTGKLFAGSFAEAAAVFRDLLEDSVRLRLRADVPVGSCLSGGLDSSSIVCIANRLLRGQGADGRQKTFSACSRVKRFDERSYIEEVVAITGVDAHYTYPELEDLLPLLERVTWHQDEPFGSTSIYAQWAVFKLAAENEVKVMLDGQGADEQLAGYHSYFAVLLGSMFRHGRWIAALRESLAMRRLHGYSFLYLGKRFFANLFPSLRLSASALAKTAAHSTGWLDHERLDASPVDPLSRFPGCEKNISAWSYHQLTASAVPMLLHWEDRNSMAHSIEARVPFLDYRIAEFLLGLPDEHKLTEGVTKRILRETMKGSLPESVRNRTDKLGFATPEEVWLRETKTDWFSNMLRVTIENSDRIVKPEVMDIFRQMVTGKRPFDFFIWRLISFGVWVRRFNVDFAFENSRLKD